MKTKILLPMVCALSLFGATNTVTTFQPENSVNDDQYGNKQFTREVSIDTKNYKVDNFFGGFSEADKSQYNSISSKGLFLVTVEANSICANDGELAEEGCSGQKPFLMNKSFTDSMADGQVYEVPFNRANQYTSSSHAFFALDVDRDTQYYTDDTPAGGKKSFFQKIKELFEAHFSHDTMSYGDNLTGDEQKTRDRYIANIISGIQKDYRLTKKVDDKSENTPLNPTINTPVSLLDYDSLIVNETTGCNIGFVNLSSSSLTCKMIGGFHMGDWMPFFNQTNDIKTEASTTMIDTETSLLSAVGDLNGVNIFEDMKSNDPKDSSILQEIFKPVTFMFDNMMSFFFGSRDNAKAVTFSNHYDFTKYDKQLTMSIPVTQNGSEVNDFANFSLVGLDSVYGVEVESCVIYNSDHHDTYTITSASPERPSLFVDKGPAVMDNIFDNIIYDELKEDFVKKIKFVFFMPVPHLYLETTKDELFSWCARRQEYNSKGLIGRIKDDIANLFTWRDTKEGQMDKFMEDERFDVKSYTEKVHRGLILHLKKEDLGTNNPANKINIKFLKSVK